MLAAIYKGRVVLATVLLLLSACAGGDGPPPGSNNGDDENNLGVDEVCTDGFDNDRDGDVDCTDTDCANHITCVPSGEDCDDGEDDDLDGDVDCADADCVDDPACEGGEPEICDDGTDNDGDGDVDCDDPDCSGHQDCADAGKEICGDGADNDEDGAVDCDDDDCVGDEACVEPGDEVCGDGEDNDGDGAVDCDDADCAAAPDCQEDCDDGADNDGDGDVDCADSDCTGDETCGEVCDDNQDNDGDGDFDCADADCIGAEACREICDDRNDNDLDGDIDCADADCDGDPACTEVCDDGVDNDQDDAVDCDDPDCDGEVACTEVCDDGVDNDQDDAVDCDDPDCDAHVACTEVCDDGVDNDTDELIDCADPDCDGALACQEVCDDGVDNDLDTQVDCADSDCEDDIACQEVCDDGVDNDQDEVVDCDDPDCANAVVCQPEVCNDGADNDADGQIDCDDDECVGHPDCQACGDGEVQDGEQCDDGDTDNGDGCNALCFDERVDARVGGQFEGAFPRGEAVTYFFTVHNDPTELVAATGDGNGGCPPGDTIVTLYRVDNGRTQVARDDDGGPGLCSRLVRSLGPGDYELDVTAFFGGAHDGYFLDVDLWVDVGDSGTYAGGFDTDQYDLFRFSQSEALPLRAETSDGQGGCGGDTFMTLSSILDGVRTEVASNDDGGVGRCSALDIDALPPGDYELRVDGDSRLLAYSLDVAHEPEPFCGDGNLDEGEACDDGNNDDGDRCDANCNIEPYCGDGNVDDGEECDDGNEEDGDRCSSLCAIEPFCGDGNLDDGEACDDGNEEDGDGCAADCTVEPFCGDGNTDPGEECDDGGNEPGDGCDANCVIEPFCGDGNVDDGEQCDDGGNEPGDGCDANCQFEQSCGNGIEEGLEQCDDNNVVNGDGCNAACYVERTDVNNGGRFRTGFPVGEVTIFTFSVENDPTHVNFLTSDGDGGCVGVGDTTLRLFSVVDDVRTQVEYDDDGGPGLCSQIDRDIAPGNYELEVGELGNNQALAEVVLDTDIFVNIDGGGTFDGAFAASGFDLFRFELGQGGDVVLFTGDGQGGCPTGDTTMRLFPFADGEVGDQIEFDDDDGVGLCSRIARNLAAGGYQVQVQGFSNRAHNGYVLTAQLPGPPVCGNGLLEGDEQCDDSNGDNGDGCNSLCFHERVDANPRGQFHTGFPAAVSTTYYFSIENDPGQVVLETSDGQGACSGVGDTYLELFRVVDGQRTSVATNDDGGVGLCSRIAQGLTPGDYELDVRDLINRAIASVYVDIDIFVDANGGGAFDGGFAEDQNDLFRFSLDATTSVELFTGDGQGGCPGDTFMTLYSVVDGLRSTVATNDDGGFGVCSRIARSLDAGAYEIEVRGYLNRAVADYVLTAEIPDQ